MPHYTKEECLARGIPWHEVKHKKTRRAFWRDYWRAGEYGITIHLNTDSTGRVDRSMLLSEVVGDCKARPPFCVLPSGSVLPNLEGHTSSCAPRSSILLPGGPDACLGCDGDPSLPDSVGYPRTKLTPLGRLVDACLRTMGTHKLDGNVRLGRYVIMPTHLHLTIRVINDLPMHTYRGKVVRVTLSDVIRGFEQGCTSWWLRYLEGESVEEILANSKRGHQTTANSTNITCNTQSPQHSYNTNNCNTIAYKQQPPSLWNNEGFNDIILYNQDRKVNWLLYVMQNPYYWRMRQVYPLLFEHRLHLKVAGSDYSAYGCMFLLRRPDRIQVMCHRFKMDDNGRRVRDPRTGEYIPYTSTEAFQQQKASILSKCEQENAVLVSPAISEGERAIIYEALQLGYPVIKLVKDPIPEKGHPINIDREYCAQGQMLVLGPWVIEDKNNFSSRFGTSDSKYAKFHNLNAMAADLCQINMLMSIDPKTLEECR